MTNFAKVKIWDGTNDATVDANGRQDVVQHSHPDNGRINFYADISSTTDYILIDISDTTNYPHTETHYIHIEDLDIQVDATSNADYKISIGFLESVDATDGDYYEIAVLNGTKQTGQNKDLYFPYYPNGAKCETSSIATSNKSLNDTSFQTDVNLKSTLDPSTADAPSGSGDLVVRVTMAAGSINLNINAAYHSH